MIEVMSGHPIGLVGWEVEGRTPEVGEGAILRERIRDRERGLLIIQVPLPFQR